jgi:hypothetical protein
MPCGLVVDDFSSNAYNSKKTGSPCFDFDWPVFLVSFGRHFLRADGRNLEPGLDLKPTPRLALSDFSSLQLISLLGQLGIVFLLAYLFSQPPRQPVWAWPVCGAAVYDYDMTPKVVALLVFGFSGMGLTALVYQKADHWMPRIGMWLLGTIMICATVFVPPVKTIVTPQHECDLSDVRF